MPTMEFDPTQPAAHRAIELVRQHHGLPKRAKKDDLDETSTKWAKYARRCHLKAKRRVIDLDEIPEAQYPALLEIHGGSHFVILTGKRDSSTYTVQFPDSRESDVSADRLSESYGGQCIFLKPQRTVRKTGEGGGSSSPGRKFRDLLRSAHLSKGAFGFNLVVLFLTLLIVYSNESALGGVANGSPILPLFAVGVSALALAGVIGLRRELFRRRLAAHWIDLAFVPVLFATAFAFVGWSIVPVAGLGILLVACLLSSRRLGSVPSRLQRHWKLVVASAFLVGAISLSFSYFQGTVDLALMNGALALSTYAIYLTAQGAASWQSIRLALAS
ncbi:MAG: cysteine peptidase family C39 domain-containing protein [Verrucomicrobiota bacterium]